MQVKRICSKCNKEYYVEHQDTLSLCHECYIEDYKNTRIESILNFLLHHNKNYTKKQYYMLLELQEILEK